MLQPLYLQLKRPFCNHMISHNALKFLPYLPCNVTVKQYMLLSLRIFPTSHTQINLNNTPSLEFAKCFEPFLHRKSGNECMLRYSIFKPDNCAPFPHWFLSSNKLVRIRKSKLSLLSRCPNNFIAPFMYHSIFNKCMNIRRCPRHHTGYTPFPIHNQT